jgi:hypothetical protein
MARLYSVQGHLNRIRQANERRNERKANEKRMKEKAEAKRERRRRKKLGHVEEAK